MSSPKDYLVGRVLFPFTNFLFNRRKVLSSYRQLCKTEWYPESELYNIQLSQLKKVVEYSYRFVPYYQALYRNIGLEPGDIKNLEDIRLIPPLSRGDVIERHREMVDFRLQKSIPFAERSKRGPGEPIPFARLGKHRLVRNTSSGSTGAPTVFFEDGSRTALNWAYELRVKNWYGVKPGEKEARITRLSTNYVTDSRSLALRQSLWHQLILPGANLKEKEYEFLVDRIRTFRPVNLWGLPSAIAGLAEYIKRKGLDLAPFKVRLVVAWAAPLYEHEKKLLEEVFCCPVTNIYGSREVGHVAAICPAGSFHINQENLIVESEKTGNGATEVEELLVTNLDISPMPFIRYRMGDLGRIERSTCSCCRSLQTLTNLLGRTGEVFITRDGRMISPNFWCRVFMSAQHVGQFKRFQIAYTKEKNIRIIIEKGPRFSEELEYYIRCVVRENFSSDTHLDLEYVPEIKPQVSGKYQMIINEGR